MSASSATIQSNVPNDAPSYPPRSFLAPNGPQATQATAADRVLRPGPLSILVSQRDQRMYVRKGLEPVFDFPVAIAKSGRPLGTHVFTARADKDDAKTFHWSVVSLPSLMPKTSRTMKAMTA